MGPESTDQDPSKRQEKRHKTKEEGRVKIGAEIGIFLPQHKGHLELVESGRVQRRTLPQSLWRECDPGDTLNSDCWPPPLRESVSVLSCRVCGDLLKQP